MTSKQLYNELINLGFQGLGNALILETPTKKIIVGDRSRSITIYHMQATEAGRIFHGLVDVPTPENMLEAVKVAMR